MPQITKILTPNDLPAPPPGKKEWPWTEQGKPLDDQMFDSSQYPRISIVIPSYNYGQYIEETIRSVLLQSYSNLEFIIIDGGSTDQTLDIIKVYEPWLCFWCSEPDKGQTDAINKGFEHCTGDIFAWLNADDAYKHPNVLKTTANLYQDGYEFIVGQCEYVNLTQQEISKEFDRKALPVNFERYLKHWSCPILHQPSVFVSITIAKSCFPLDTYLHSSMDYQFFLRVLRKNPKSIWVDDTFSKAYLHQENKTLLKQPKVSERFSIAFNESESLPAIGRLLYRLSLEDIRQIQLLLSEENFPSPLHLFITLIKRPSLLRWILFWKVLTKSLLGDNFYRKLKKAFESYFTSNS
jgi:glycosyltransferase involved in cell wall biosynthesis